MILKKWNGSMDVIDLVQDRDKWRALVKAITNIRAPYNEENILTSQEGLCIMLLIYNKEGLSQE